MQYQFIVFMALTQYTESFFHSSCMTLIMLNCNNSSNPEICTISILPPLHRTVHQKHECIHLASHIHQEGLQGFWGIGYDIVKFVVDGVYSEDSVFSNIGVMMFQAGVADQDRIGTSSLRSSHLRHGSLGIHIRLFADI